ncbi:MAG: hypothetical protein KIS96_10840 [Bauldia sp.]|nr:hypothetical protein [Bauldia sp.]
MKSGLKLSLFAPALLVFATGSSHATGDDPAVQACEYLVESVLVAEGASYARLSAALQGNVVALQFSSNAPEFADAGVSGALCEFSYNEASGTFGVRGFVIEGLSVNADAALGALQSGAPGLYAIPANTTALGGA